MTGDNAPVQQDDASGGESAMVVNIEFVTIAYLSQQDIASLLGQGPTMVGVWRHRFADFPVPDSMTGLGTRGVPGWLPDRMTEIKAWLAAHPGLAAGGG